MNPDAYQYILLGSIAGGVAGMLVMWNRKRSQAVGDNQKRRFAVMLIGTASCAYALVAFARAFGAQTPFFAALIMIVITGWAAVCGSVARLPIPPSLFQAHDSEVAILRSRWTGVRLFGVLLRRTPLRHLGGRVYFSEANGEPRLVLEALRDAQRVHLWALLFCCPWLVYWAIQARWISVISALVIQAPLNIYPVMHLRYVTWRLERYWARMKRRNYSVQNCVPG